jgi:hypothetical protein
MMAGLAMVVKLVPSGVTYHNSNGTQTFRSGGTDIKAEAKDIASRLFLWIWSSGWILKNEVTGNPDAGVVWSNGPYPLDPCKALAGGSNLRFMSALFAKAYFAILSDFNPFLSNTAYLLFKTALLFDNAFQTSDFLFSSVSNFYQPFYHSLGQAAYHIATLAAIGDYYGTGTDLFLTGNSQFPYDGGLTRECLYLPLLHQVLYSASSSLIPSSYYTCILDRAPCLGPDGIEGTNYFWGGPAQDVLIYGANNSTGRVNAYYDGISFLWLFNLLSIADPSYLSHTPYTTYTPFQIAPPTLNLVQDEQLFAHDLTVDEHRNHLASISITAEASPVHAYKYIIRNAGNGYPPRAEVNFQAGRSILLKPGFEARSGCLFYAHIDPTIQAMQCGVGNDPYETADMTNTCSSELPPSPIVTYKRPWHSGTSLESIYDSLLSARMTALPLQDKLTSVSNTDQVTVRPNPSSGEFLLSIPTEVNEAFELISVVDLVGREVINLHSNKETTLILDMDAQPNGIYFVHVHTSANRDHLLKIVKHN